MNQLPFLTYGQGTAAKLREWKTLTSHHCVVQEENGGIRQTSKKRTLNACPLPLVARNSPGSPG